MLGKIKKFQTMVRLIADTNAKVGKLENELNELKLLCGSIHANINRNNPAPGVNPHEFKVFSQFGDDGIIQYLTSVIEIKNRTFIEFGVEDFFESNTRFLMMNNNWEGFVLDGAKEKYRPIDKKQLLLEVSAKKAADAFITGKTLMKWPVGNEWV